MFAKSLGIHPLDPGRKDREGLIAPEPGEEAKKGPAWGGTGQSAPQLPRSLSLSSGGPKLQTGQGMCSYSVAVTAGCREGTGVGCHFLLHGIFPTQGSNPGLLHCRRILCQLSIREAWVVKNWKQNCRMTQQSHYWAYTPRKPELKETRVPRCSSQHCL